MRIVCLFPGPMEMRRSGVAEKSALVIRVRAPDFGWVAPCNQRVAQVQDH